MGNTTSWLPMAIFFKGFVYDLWFPAKVTPELKKRLPNPYITARAIIHVTFFYVSVLTGNDLHSKSNVTEMTHSSDFFGIASLDNM